MPVWRKAPPPEPKASGKARLTDAKPTRHTFTVKRPFDHSGPAPRLGKVGVSLLGSTVATVDVGSPAWIAGIRLLDTILAVDGIAISGPSCNQALATPTARFGHIVEFKRAPILHVERPPRAAFEDVVARAASGLDREWLGAISACVRDDVDQFGVCSSLLSSRGVEWRERTITAEESSAVALAAFAVDAPKPLPIGGTTLVDVALDAGSTEVLRLLLLSMDEGLDEGQLFSHGYEDSVSGSSSLDGSGGGSSSVESGAAHSRQSSGGIAGGAFR
mmetsp:Transcript_8476/g.26587  ORF Transcript_8476/g.26587 Transcript_8476/m.26587 type:complete len:275 (+) Transcript_8476:64-888(+)